MLEQSLINYTEDGRELNGRVKNRSDQNTVFLERHRIETTICQCHSRCHCVIYQVSRNKGPETKRPRVFANDKTGRIINYLSCLYALTSTSCVIVILKKKKKTSRREKRCDARRFLKRRRNLSVRLFLRRKRKTNPSQLESSAVCIRDFGTPLRGFPSLQWRWHDYTFYKYRATDVPTSCSDVESTTAG